MSVDEQSANLFEQACRVFEQACSAFERGDMEEHKRLQIVHSGLGQQHYRLVAVQIQTVH